VFKIYICTIALFVSLDAREFYVDDDGRVYITPQDNRKELSSKDSRELENFKLYVDESGAIYTKPSANRKSLAKEQKEDGVLLSKSGEKNNQTFIKNLEFSGLHYFGYTYVDPKNHSKYLGSSSGFDMRRNYIGVKAFLNEKDYFRVTIDATKEIYSDTHRADIFIKYAYLYLDKVMPYTGVKIGIAHRPWVDYEQNNSWFYRSFNKVFAEEGLSATSSGLGLVNSADLGVNVNTKSRFFSSEVGVYNGEGYNSNKNGANQKNDTKLSLEWRFSGHLLGDGDKKLDKNRDRYAHISTFGMLSHNHKDDDIAIGSAGEFDREFYGIHGVYNEPLYLLGAQYIIAKDRARDRSLTDTLKYRGYSINGEIRAYKDFTIIGRYDVYDIDKISKISAKKTSLFSGNKTIMAIAYRYNQYVAFIGSLKLIDEKDSTNSKDVYMLSTEIKW